MRPRLVVAFAVVATLFMAACGDRDAAKPLGVPSTSASAASSGAAETTVVAPITTVEDTDIHVIDAAATTAASIDEGLSAYDTLPPTQGTMFEGDVRTDDPLPDQADAATDPALAETDVRYAFQHWILIDLDKDLRGRLVENGEVNADRMATAMEANRGLISCARIAVDLVQFTDAEHALVEFDMNCGTSRSSYFPNQLSGSALYQNGTWRISSATLCLLALSSGIDCAGVGADNPVSPAAFELTVVPNGYTWTGGPIANVFASDGSGQWENTATRQTLTIRAEALAGVSKLDAADSDFVLSSPRFMTTNGSAVQVGDRPGRGEQDGSAASLAYVRADDVVVHIWASDSTLDQLIAVAAAVVPSDVVPSPPEYNGTVAVAIDPEVSTPDTFNTGD